MLEGCSCLFAGQQRLHDGREITSHRVATAAMSESTRALSHDGSSNSGKTERCGFRAEGLQIEAACARLCVYPPPFGASKRRLACSARSGSQLRNRRLRVSSAR